MADAYEVADAGGGVMDLEWNWHELPDWEGRNAPTCQRCWHAVAMWFCETTEKYHCCNCKNKLNDRGV